MMTDPIADMLTRIRNAQKSKLERVVLPYSNVKKNIADILCREGFLTAVEKEETVPAQLILVLKYEDGMPAISDIKRISKPGHRVYKKIAKVGKVLSGFGIDIISTSKGLMTDKEARKAGIGGEIICSVY